MKDEIAWNVLRPFDFTQDKIVCSVFTCALVYLST